MTDNNERQVGVTRYQNPIRAAIAIAELGDMDTAMKVVTGQIDFVDVDPTDAGPTIILEGGKE